LNLLCLGPEINVKYYNEYFINAHVFHTEYYGHGRKIYNSRVYVNGSTSNKFEVDYYGKLKEVIELQYHIELNKVFLFKCYWYNATNKGIIVDLQHSLVKINTKARLRNVDNIFIFIKECQQVYYHALIPLEMIILGLTSYM
jgi:hypothetical protein